MNQLSDRLNSLSPSATLAMSQKSAELKAQGVDVINLSVGEPDFNTPDHIKEAAKKAIDDNFSRYSPVPGYPALRNAIVEKLKKENGLEYTAAQISCANGAKQSVCNAILVLVNPGDEVIVPAPYWVSYPEMVKLAEGTPVIVPAGIDQDFKITPAQLEAAITPKTKAVIVNNPNNPTGVVYREETIRAMAEVMERKQKEYGTAIYLIADEPYRELAYDGVTVPYLTKYYDNTIVGYSYSKSLSLPGERIGYLVIPDEVDDFENVICAANVANRILGFVNAPSLMQLAVAKCLEEQTDVAAYDTNRKMLLDALTEYGYEVVKPEGAFYLWVKTMEEDDPAFVARAKEYNLLVVPGSSFMCPGYVRIAYCVDPEMIKRSLPAFEKLAQSYQ